MPFAPHSRSLLPPGTSFEPLKRTGGALFLHQLKRRGMGLLSFAELGAGWVALDRGRQDFERRLVGELRRIMIKILALAVV